MAYPNQDGIFQGNIGRNLHPYYFPKWNTSLLKVMNGDADSKVLIVGDSTSAGQGNTLQTTFVNTRSWPSRLVPLMTSTALPWSVGGGIPPSNSAPINDNRWTVGTGWSRSTIGGWGSNATYAASAAATGDLVYGDSRVNADTFDLYYLRGLLAGASNVTPTGGSVTNLSAGAGTAFVAKATLTAGSLATTNTVTVNPPSTNNFWVTMVEPYNSTARTVRVANVGVSGATTMTWLTNFDTLGGAPHIEAYRPDLTIIMLGINDSTQGFSTPFVSSNIMQLVQAAQLTGDVLLMSIVPSQLTVSPNYAWFQPAYTNALEQLFPNTPYINLNQFAQSWSNWNGAGYMYDSLHPNDYGYWTIAQLVSRALKQIIFVA